MESAELLRKAQKEAAGLRREKQLAGDELDAVRQESEARAARAEAQAKRDADARADLDRQLERAHAQVKAMSEEKLATLSDLARIGEQRDGAHRCWRALLHHWARSHTRGALAPLA